MNILAIDFETYYATDFSLTRLTMEEYIRDDRFEVIGVAVQKDLEEPQWFSGTLAETKAWLEQFDWSNSFGLAHNAMFDAAILSWIFGIKPMAWLDTLAMARATDGLEVGNSLAKLADRYGVGRKGTEVIDAKGLRRADFPKAQLDQYGEYCKNDASLTYLLFQIMVERFNKHELKLIDLTIKMFSEPVLRLDTPMLEQHLMQVKARKEKLLDACISDKDTLMSNPKLADLLVSLGVEPPMKISPANGKETYAFAKSDEGFKALAEYPDERVQAIVAARLGTKSTLEETRTERFINISKRGSMPVPLRYYAAHTGRWGGDDKLNLQNLPRKSLLKDAIIAPDGCVLIDADSSQIEARTVAWLAGQTDLTDAFERREDVYKIMASSIYGKAETEITDGERFVGKTTILGCFGADTEVLTDSGWKRIVTVQATDLLWDGEEWVKHQGLVPQGEKEVLTAWGVDATLDHEILTEHGWLEWSEVATNPIHFLSALNKVNLLSLTGNNTPNLMVNLLAGTQSFNVRADGKVKSTGITLRAKRLLGAIHAPKYLATKLAKSIGVTKILSLIGHIENACLTACQVVSHGAIQLLVKHTHIMAVEGLQFTNLGAKTERSSYATSYHLMGGMNQNETLTASTTTKGMNPTTYAFLPNQKMPKINDESENLNSASKNSKKRTQTYDIAYSGLRNRYTIKTTHGAIIVHNCGYGMGAQKFQVQLRTFGVEIPDAEASRIVQVYRDTYPHIPRLWKEANSSLEALRTKKTAQVGCQAQALTLTESGFLLPSGLYLNYPDLQVDGGGQYSYASRRGRIKIYGGKVVENLCQAIARCIIGEQMLRIARRYKVALTVHDAVMAVVKESEQNEAMLYIDECMKWRPKWAQDLPLACELGVGKSYGDCSKKKAIEKWEIK